MFGLSRSDALFMSDSMISFGQTHHNVLADLAWPNIPSDLSMLDFTLCLFNAITMKNMIIRHVGNKKKRKKRDGRLIHVSAVDH